MEINRYIKDLLLEHDCVVVPGLGGFIGSHIPAEHQSITKAIYPPSKRITFNGQLQRNDGLLVHHVALAEGISYEDAEQEVLHFVKNSKTRLEQSGLVMFPEVGKLMADAEGTISFHPTPGRNLLQESFGLRPIHYRQTYNMDTEKTEPAEAMVLQPVRHQSGKLKRLVSTYGISVAAMLALAIFVAKDIYIKPLALDQFSFFSPERYFGKTEEIPAALPSTFASEPMVAGSLEKTGALPDEIDEAENNAEAITTPEPAKETPKPEAAPAKETSPANNTVTPHITQINTSAVSAGYYIVLGAYSSEKNARKFIAEQKGLAGLVTIPVNNKLYRVALPAGTIESAAINQLDAQRQQSHPAAWLVKNQY